MKENENFGSEVRTSGINNRGVTVGPAFGSVSAFVMVDWENGAVVPERRDSLDLI